MITIFFKNYFVKKRRVFFVLLKMRYSYYGMCICQKGYFSKRTQTSTNHSHFLMEWKFYFQKSMRNDNNLNQDVISTTNWNRTFIFFYSGFKREQNIDLMNFTLNGNWMKTKKRKRDIMYAIINQSIYMQLHFLIACFPR